MSYQHMRVFGCLAYVHVAKDRSGNLDPKSKPCIFLGYGEDEFSYRLWDLAEKKVIRTRDIIFMEEKIIVDWEMEKKGTTSESTDRDRLDETRVHPIGSRMLDEEQRGRVDFGQRTESTGVEHDVGPESDSDEEPTKEAEQKPTTSKGGRRYPLRERKVPRRFSDEECVLLTN